MISVHYLHRFATRDSQSVRLFQSIWEREQRDSFIIFAYLTLILVVAAFASIVAGTFGTTNAAELLLVRQLRIRTPRLQWFHFYLL